MIQLPKFFFSLLLIPYLNSGFTQSRKQPVEVLLKSKQFLFVPASVNPLSGRTRYLDGYFDLKVKNDSLVSYLPYFGRTTMAPIGSDDTGMRFTSTEFTYSYKPGKKGSYNVVIQVKDNANSNKFYLTVYNNYTALLVASSNFRDQISFRGDIRELK